VISGLQNLNPNRVGQSTTCSPARKLRRVRALNGVDARSTCVCRRHPAARRDEHRPDSTDNCAVVAAVPESAIADQQQSALLPVDTPFLTQIKFLGSYTVPKCVQVSATVQSLPAPNITANYVASNALIQPSLGRPLSGGAANATINLISPGVYYGDRINSMDLRFSKIVRISSRRLSFNLELYNALNGSSVVLLNPNFATWQVPQQILLPRFAKLGFQFDF
jgi:hypothetical protein